MSPAGDYPEVPPGGEDRRASRPGGVCPTSARKAEDRGAEIDGIALDEQPAVANRVSRRRCGIPRGARMFQLLWMSREEGITAQRFHGRPPLADLPHPVHWLLSVDPDVGFCRHSSSSAGPRPRGRRTGARAMTHRDDRPIGSRRGRQPCGSRVEATAEVPTPRSTAFGNRRYCPTRGVGAPGRHASTRAADGTSILNRPRCLAGAQRAPRSRDVSFGEMLVASRATNFVNDEPRADALHALIRVWACGVQVWRRVTDAVVRTLP